MKLSLGVVDIPYADEEGKTTGDVAEILEAEYGIMQYFFDSHKDDIIRELEKGLQGQIENLMLGAPVSDDVFAESMSAVEAMFRQFLTLEEMNYKVYGVPTIASRKGVNHRFKHPYAKANPSRPSFIDTGLFQASFKSWIEGNL